MDTSEGEKWLIPIEHCAQHLEARSQSWMTALVGMDASEIRRHLRDRWRHLVGGSFECLQTAVLQCEPKAMLLSNGKCLLSLSRRESNDTKGFCIPAPYNRREIEDDIRKYDLTVQASAALAGFLMATAGMYDTTTVQGAAGRFSELPTESAGVWFKDSAWTIEKGCEDWERFPLLFMSKTGDGLFLDRTGRVGWIVAETGEVRIGWNSLGEAAAAFAREWMKGGRAVDSWTFRDIR